MLVGNGTVSQSVISTVSYQTENTSLVLYDKSKILPVPVANNGTLVTPYKYDNTTGKLKVRIPHTFGDTEKNLEPFTESYPEYGQGGELQMICLMWDEDLIIKYDRLDILLNPRTDLILKEEITK